MARTRIACCALVAFTCGLAGAPGARAATVLVLQADGHVRARHETLPPPERDPTPARDRAPAPRVRAGAVAARAATPTVVRELKRLRDAGDLSLDSYDARRASYDAARRAMRHLAGARRAELAGVIADLDAMAARGELDPSRLPALWQTLDANVRWWTTGPLLSASQRVGFQGSELVWQHYAGHGIQIQWLGTFGKLNALWKSRAPADRLETMVREALSLASERAGGLAWEYLFPFDGGRPPWVSSLAQGTGLQSLARAAVRLHREGDVLPVVREGLGIFTTPPPAGVRVATDGGAHYVQYSSLPGVRILNGFIQSLVGLHDFAAIAGDATAQALFEQGDAAARVEVPRYDTGAWSLYSRGTQTVESDLGYHVLLRDFLRSLCARTAEPVYCVTADRFTTDLTTPPVVRPARARVRAGRLVRLRFSVSKVSRVTLRVVRGARTVAAFGLGTVGHGSHSVRWVAPRRAGTYSLRVSATDLAGNPATAAARVLVTRRP